MSYGVRIHRAGQPIQKEEWLDIIERDPSMQLKGRFEAKNPKTGEVIQAEAPGLAAWQSHPSGRPVLFDLSRGRVVVANPDEHTLTKMRKIASQLGAAVIGDADERC